MSVTPPVQTGPDSSEATLLQSGLVRGRGDGGDDGMAPLHILLFAHSTAHTERRSGIHRVTVELARHLSTFATVDFVKWDATQGQLAYFDRYDLEALFRSRTLPPGVRVNPYAARVNDRFAATLDPSRRYWLVYPEIAYHLPDGNETFARLVSQCRDYGVKVASVFYDIIPITNPGYQMYRVPHLRCMIEMSRSDLIIPISHHVGTVLSAFYSEAEQPGDPLGVRPVMDRIHAVPLPEGKRITLPPPENGERDTILMVGTVEPRKRQVEVLKAVNRLASTEPAVARLKVVVIGSLHPDCAVEFHNQVAANPNITYHDYSSEAFVQECYRRTLFTVFASNDEGYGLPIAESVARGIPCLTADFGSMAEIAREGGCVMVDVENDDALADGIRRLATDKALHQRLVDEIARRSLRDWRDYAGDVVQLIESTDARGHEAAGRIMGLDVSMPDDGGVRINALSVGTVPVRLVSLTTGATAGALPSAVFQGLTGVSFFGSAEELLCLPEAVRAILYRADVAAFADEDVYGAFLAAAEKDGFVGLLPTRVIRDGTLRAMLDALRTLAVERVTRERWADDERILMMLARHWRDESEKPPVRLGIVISTYNRSPFVYENVRWLLNLIGPYGGEIKLIVVDNASTDDTWHALQPFVGHPQFSLHRNSANTGMLGNLRVCSMLRGCRHLWVTGDDDYIVPDILADVLHVLRNEPGLPLAFVNFAVYHRAAFGALDNAEVFIRERQPLAPTPSPGGFYPVNRIAGEHDNLFTAIYPIIFRSDVLAACFNHPFTGVPFGDLVESVPTTRIILDNYRYVPAFWFERIGIVGNAHNSWSRHRPRWHALLMPMVFELAREAGVDNEKLYSWSRIHKDLFHEAVGIAIDKALPAHLELPDDLDVGRRVFREELSVPDTLLRSVPASGW